MTNLRVTLHEGHQHAAETVEGNVLQFRTAAISQIELKDCEHGTVILTAGSNTKCVEAGMRIVATVTADCRATRDPGAPAAGEGKDEPAVIFEHGGAEMSPDEYASNHWSSHHQEGGKP